MVPCDDLAYSKYTAMQGSFCYASFILLITRLISMHMAIKVNRLTISTLQFSLAFAMTWQAYGYSMAARCDTMSADGLVGVIASHFRFDPATGKDLPVA